MPHANPLIVIAVTHKTSWIFLFCITNVVQSCWVVVPHADLLVVIVVVTVLGWLILVYLVSVIVF
jgi:hypothetical protein